MKYDIASKYLMQLSGVAIIARFMGINSSAIHALKELPTETTTLKRADTPNKLRLKDGNERVLLIEHQTYWEKKLPLRLLEYRAHYCLKYDLPVDTMVFLAQPNSRAQDRYTDHEMSLRFRLIRFWQLQATDFLEGDVELLPLIPLMQDGLTHAGEAELRGRP